MPDPKQKAYERLKELLAETEASSYAWFSTGKFTEWKQNVQNAFRRIYGEGNTQGKDLNQIHFSPVVVSSATKDSDFEESFQSGMNRAKGLLRSVIQEYDDYELQTATITNGAPTPPPAGSPTRKVFLVHGHDDQMKQTVARFLEQLGIEVIILHEKASGGTTIIEKFERHSDVSYAVVLLSPDDQGGKNEAGATMKPRARQNVVLELGYFIGKLGRKHVCALLKLPVEIPSDFAGVLYVTFDGESWKMELVRELKHAGFDIDANKAFGI